jgi:hypothetical protein
MGGHLPDRFTTKKVAGNVASMITGIVKTTTDSTPDIQPTLGRRKETSGQHLIKQPFAT